MKKAFLNFILLSISILFSILVLEFILRIFDDDKFYVWNPNLKATLTPEPELFPGIRGESRFIVNSDGFRGDEIPDDADYKIIAIGGSTTECVYLDQEETWTYLLQNELSKDLNKTVWVGNAGKSGMTTYEHIVQMEELLKQNKETDLVIMLVGINDFQRRLTLQNEYEPGTINQKTYSRAFDRLPDNNPNLPFYKKTELWSSLSKLKYLFIKAEYEQDIKGIALQEWRDNRKAAGNIITGLPDLNSALDDYERSLKKIIEIARANKTSLLFISQPVIWDENLSQELADLCWFGGTGNYQVQKGKDYYSLGALEKGMDLYNERLKIVSNESNVFFIDLSGKLPKDTTVYYDDCHYNENGSKMVADLILKDIKTILN